MGNFEVMFENLKANKYIIVSSLLVDMFIDYCNERGVCVNGGAFVVDEFAQVLYI